MRRGHRERARPTSPDPPSKTRDVRTVSFDYRWSELTLTLNFLLAF